MATEPTEGTYLALVDSKVCQGIGLATSTYEHALPHGVLIRVCTERTDGAVSETGTFVPSPPAAGGPYR